MTALLIRHPKAYSASKHAQNLTALIAHNALSLLVIQDWHRVAGVVLWLRFKVDMAQVGKVLMALKRIRNDILARLLFILGDEAPATLTEMPVHDGKGNKVLETLELSGNQSTMSLQDEKY